MRQGEANLTGGMNRGLRRFSVSPRSSMWLLECLNLAPAEDGLEIHEEITSLNDDVFGAPVVDVEDFWIDHGLDVWVDEDENVFEDD